MLLYFVQHKLAVLFTLQFIRKEACVTHILREVAHCMHIVCTAAWRTFTLMRKGLFLRMDKYEPLHQFAMNIVIECNHVSNGQQSKDAIWHIHSLKSKMLGTHTLVTTQASMAFDVPNRQPTACSTSSLLSFCFLGRQLTKTGISPIRYMPNQQPTDCKLIAHRSTTSAV